MKIPTVISVALILSLSKGEGVARITQQSLKG
jgi:hypothetical protein